jgi:hypothetical protein
MDETAEDPCDPPAIVTATIPCEPRIFLGCLADATQDRMSDERIRARSSQGTRS